MHSPQSRSSNGHDLMTQAATSRSRLYRMALSLCRDPDLADDIAQEALVRAWINKDKLRDAAAINKWLYRIVRNCWSDHYRRKPVLTEFSVAEPVDAVTPEDVCCLHEIVAQVRTAVISLPVDQRDVMTLVHLSGHSLLEAARHLETPAGTVMSRLFRAKRALRHKLIDADLGPSRLL